MPTFTKLDPNEVQIGRERQAHAIRARYIAALRAADAGAIDLEPGERPAVVKRRLREAAKQAGLRVRSAWADVSQATLLWKRY